MRKQVTFGQLRGVLTGLGFRETRRPEGVALKHKKSDTLFLFRPHAETERVAPADVFIVRHMLDQKGLLEPESFEVLLTKTPA